MHAACCCHSSRYCSADCHRHSTRPLHRCGICRCALCLSARCPPSAHLRLPRRLRFSPLADVKKLVADDAVLNDEALSNIMRDYNTEHMTAAPLPGTNDRQTRRGSGRACHRIENGEWRSDTKAMKHALELRTRV